jgi:hypothetical protein
MRHATESDFAEYPHSPRAERTDVLATLPHFPAAMNWNARRGCDGLRGDGGRAHGTRAETGPDVGDHLASMPAVNGTDVRVAIAESSQQMEAARSLVRKRYAWRGYEVEPADDHAGDSPRERMNQEITFVAASAEATVGTVTLRLDGPLGLRAEETHGDVIQSARLGGRRICELTRLAVAERVDSHSVLASLFSLAYAAGWTIHSVTDVFIEVNPRHVAFYSRILGFVVAAGERMCERVRAPSVLLHVEVGALAERLDALVRRTLAQPMLAQAA